MPKLHIRNILLTAGFLIGFVSPAHADESFCDSQLKLADTYLMPIPSVVYQMVTIKLGEAQCFFHRGEIIKGQVSRQARTPSSSWPR